MKDAKIHNEIMGSDSLPGRIDDGMVGRIK